jgi:hypothetical protein
MRQLLKDWSIVIAVVVVGVLLLMPGGIDDRLATAYLRAHPEFVPGYNYSTYCPGSYHP